MKDETAQNQEKKAGGLEKQFVKSLKKVVKCPL
jgi:hypothetical protein